MSANFVNVDRETPMLLPCDLREWVAKDDLVHFVISVVESVDLRGVPLNERGTGSAQYPPRMMLGLLVYSYAMGVFSSRRIERLTYQHVGVRYLCADTHPDHDTIATFRTRQELLLRRVFTEVVQLARLMKMTRLGTVHIDGTKVLADASKRATLEGKSVEEQLELADRQLAEAMLEQAAKADQEDDDSAYRLPRELADAATRKAKLQAARELLQARQAAGETKPRLNLTDPDSRLMPDGKGRHIQAYNAQLAVDEGGLIVGQTVCQATNDRTALVATAESIVAAPAEIMHVVVDQGYDNQPQITAVEEALDTNVICAPQSSPRPPAARRTKARTQLAQTRLRRARMAHSTFGRELLHQRQTTIEPRIGFIKHVLGFQRFHVRSLPKVTAEWSLVTTAVNCRHLWLRQQARMKKTT